MRRTVLSYGVGTRQQLIDVNRVRPTAETTKDITKEKKSQQKEKQGTKKHNTNRTDGEGREEREREKQVHAFNNIKTEKQQQIAISTHTDRQTDLHSSSSCDLDRQDLSEGASSST